MPQKTCERRMGDRKEQEFFERNSSWHIKRSTWQFKFLTPYSALRLEWSHAECENESAVVP